MSNKKIFGLVLTTLFSMLNAQEIHPNNVRKAVYDSILNDISNNRKIYTIKEIYVDATVNKFDDIEMTSYGVKLSDPEYVNDEEFCKILNNTKCVDKLKIDQFTLSKIYQEHKDEKYTDFYGIYAPLDHWYTVIHHTFQYLLQNDKPQFSSVTIPVKNVYFKNGDVITNHYFYHFDLDKDFKIISFKRINF
ncbi:hypothetical protein [Faecalibacter macacae]|uniref:DUF3828 domain-containing protein n=1 Tax=Faecalibacter macacae TaxID=1859289 RepID=A0A3L9MHP5_9FLAO|nr:hypothetical protein [Faecalibacter macacae]RLZ12215.1 hypothetical protein EAH69_01435 [Faecalibacter macacae]